VKPQEVTIKRVMICSFAIEPKLLSAHQMY